MRDDTFTIFEILILEIEVFCELEKNGIFIKAKISKKPVIVMFVVGGGILASLGGGANACKIKGKANTKAQKARCKKSIWYLDNELFGIVFFNKFSKISVFVYDNQIGKKIPPTTYYDSTTKQESSGKKS